MNRKAKQERDWEEKPYNKADRARFVEFEAELEFVLTQKFGLQKILWHRDNAEETETMRKIVLLENSASAITLEQTTSAGQITPSKNKDSGDGSGSATQVKESPSGRKSKTSTETDLDNIAEYLAVRYFADKTSQMSDSAFKRFASKTSMIAMIHRERINLQANLLKITTGDVRKYIRKTKPQTIEHVRSAFLEKFTQASIEDQAQLENRLKEGLAFARVDSDGNEIPRVMSINDSVEDFFAKLEDLKSRILDAVEINKRDTYELIQSSNMVLYVKKGIHQQYQDVLSNLVTIYRQMNVKQYAVDEEQSEEDEDEEEHTSVLHSLDDYKKLDYKEVKRACINKYHSLYPKGSAAKGQARIQVIRCV